MKNLKFLICIASLSSLGLNAQVTNTFPSSGNVGIGTTNPTDKLHINEGNLNILGFNTSRYIRFTEVNLQGAFINYDGTSNVLNIGVNNINSTDMNNDNKRISIVRSTGNVGIGTITPESILHVSSSTSGDAILRLEADTDNNDEFDNPMLQLRQDGGQVGMNIGFSTDNLGHNIFGLGTRYTGQDNWDTFTINTSNGNVGIGTEVSKAKLHVKESTALGSNPGDAQILARFQGKTSNQFKESTWVVRDANGTDWTTARIHNAIGIDNSFATPNVDTKTWWERDPYNNIQSWGNSSETYMSLTYGKLGIGTTSPDSKLAVKGNIHAEEVKVDLSVPGPDYVFKEDYELRTLEEVQRHIKEHRHLPNIPSAREMETNGILVGEMNMKLLEKIEELTLYILQQEQKLNNQANIIDKQQKEIESFKILSKKLERIEKYLNLKK